MPTKSDAPLSPRELLVLAVLAERNMHGYGLVQAVDKRSDGSVIFQPTNLYRLLRRMQGAGWIQEVQQRGYSRRRNFEITPVGRALLETETNRLAQLVQKLRPQPTGFSQRQSRRGWSPA